MLKWFFLYFFNNVICFIKQFIFSITRPTETMRECSGSEKLKLPKAWHSLFSRSKKGKSPSPLWIYIQGLFLDTSYNFWVSINWCVKDQFLAFSSPSISSYKIYAQLNFNSRSSSFREIEPTAKLRLLPTFDRFWLVLRGANNFNF